MAGGNVFRTAGILLCVLGLLAGCGAGTGVDTAVRPPDTVDSDPNAANHAFRKAMAFSRDGKIADAAPWYRKAAESGHVEAQFVLGTMYRTGRGVKKDTVLAAQWYQRAANAGNAWAQFSLGNMRVDGEGIERNLPDGVRLYRLAAAQGHREAQYNLGALYYNGDSVRRDYVEAEKWFTEAASRGDTSSQFALGRMYSTPHEGVQLDRVRAHAWFTLAADNGHRKAAGAARDLNARMSVAERASAGAMARRLAAGITR